MKSIKIRFSYLTRLRPMTFRRWVGLEDKTCIMNTTLDAFSAWIHDADYSVAFDNLVEPPLTMPQYSHFGS